MSCWLSCKVRTVWIHSMLQWCIQAFPLCGKLLFTLGWVGGFEVRSFWMADVNSWTFSLPFLSRTRVSDEPKQTKRIFSKQSKAVALIWMKPQPLLCRVSNPRDLCLCLISPCCIVCSCVARIAYRAALSSGVVFVCECLQQKWEEGD